MSLRSGSLVSAPLQPTSSSPMSRWKAGCRSPVMACGNASWRGPNASAGGSGASPMARLQAPAVRLEAGQLSSAEAPQRRLDLAAAVAGLPGDIVGTAQTTAGSTTHLINAFAAHFAEVEVDMQSGRIRVLRYVAAHDS